MVALAGAERWRLASPDVQIANSATVTVVGDATSPGASSRFRGIEFARHAPQPQGTTFPGAVFAIGWLLFAGERHCSELPPRQFGERLAEGNRCYVPFVVFDFEG